MTLNKQRILSELGSVVNQLQSSDCGCMGKLFGNNNQNMSGMNSFPQQGNYVHGGHDCHGCHGCHQRSPSYGNSYAMNSPPQRPYTCMGQCNSPKLYSDTYNYLNENLMQPVVKEVYNDLSSLGPTNTIMNNELGAKMGIMQEQCGQDIALNQTNANTMNPFNSNISHMQPGANPISANAPNQQYFGGMGPQIVNMLRGESINKPMQPQQMVAGKIDDSQPPQRPVGVTPLTASVNKNYNSGYAQPGVNTRNAHNQQICAANTSNTLSNPAQQNTLRQPSYGQHTQAITKFNEMFPGVMQNDGNLGFDPMAIAIQMNPANQQQVAMNTMQKIMNNNQTVSNILEPTATSKDVEPITNTIQNTGQIHPIDQNNVITDQQAAQRNTVVPVNNQQMTYTPVNQSTIQQNIVRPQAQQRDHLNTGQNLLTIQEDPSTLPLKLQTQQNVQPIIKEPIFPVDTTKQKIYHNLNVKKHSEPAYFNTLGQPVEKLPANMYQPVLPNLPQTLSPQPTYVYDKYSKVKPTVSKTALIVENPIDKTPSRSQLQQIYQQFKGSQSYTQQNVTAPHVDSPSERHLNVKPDTRMQYVIPVEKNGGDSAKGGQLNHIEAVRYDHIGDVLVQNKHDGQAIKPEKELVGNNLKARNGLQDMVYTSYPTSAAWTFHGDGKVGQYRSHRGQRYHDRY